MHRFVFELYSFQLLCMCIFMLVPHNLDYCSSKAGFKTRKCEFSNFHLIQHCLGYSGSLVFPYELQDESVNFCKKGRQTFGRDYVESVDLLWSTAVLTILSLLLIHERGCLSIYLGLFNYSAMFYNFQCTSLVFLLLNLPKYLP